MGREVGVSLLILVGVALALAGPATGDMKAALAGGTGTTYGIDAVVRRQLMMSGRLEDGVAPELTVDLEVHRRVLAGNISPRTLNPNKQACLGSCAARGGPYTGRPCSNVYRCHH